MSSNYGFGSAGFHDGSGSADAADLSGSADADVSETAGSCPDEAIDGPQMSTTVEDAVFGALTATLDEVLDGLRTIPTAALSNADRRAVYVRFDVAVRSLTGISHTVLNELTEQRGFDGFDGSVPAALSNMVRITQRAASTRLRLAKDLGRTSSPTGGVREPVLPTTAAAQRSGTADDAHVTVIRDFLRRLNPRVDPRKRANAERQLADLTATMRPDELAGAAMRMAGHLDPDGEREKETNRARKRFFKMNKQGADLMTDGSFCVDSELAAGIGAFFGKFARPGMLNNDDISPVTDPDGDLTGADGTEPAWNTPHPSWDAPEPPTRNTRSSTNGSGTGANSGSGETSGFSTNSNGETSRSGSNHSGSRSSDSSRSASEDSAADDRATNDGHATNDDHAQSDGHGQDAHSDDVDDDVQHEGRSDRDANNDSNGESDADGDDESAGESAGEFGDDDPEFGDGSLFAPQPSEQSLSGEVANDAPGSWGAQARHNPRAGRDTRSQGQRQHDALKFLIRQTLASGVKTLGTHRGLPVTVVVSIGHADYQAATGIAVSSSGTLVAVRDAIRMSAHAHHYLAIFDDADGRPLYLMRTKRCASGDQRLVLMASDRGCTFPRCPRPAIYSQVHHLDEWADLGPTNSDKLGFGCDLHHPLVGPGAHQWATTKQGVGDPYPGRVQWHPPAVVDPTRKGRINHHHHPEEYLFPAQPREDATPDSAEASANPDDGAGLDDAAAPDNAAAPDETDAGPDSPDTPAAA